MFIVNKRTSKTLVAIIHSPLLRKQKNEKPNAAACYIAEKCIHTQVPFYNASKLGRAANSTFLVVDYDFFNTPATFLQHYFHSQQSTMFCQQFPALFENCSLLHSNRNTILHFYALLQVLLVA